jgi:hypothetical protein
MQERMKMEMGLEMQCGLTILQVIYSKAGIGIH